MKIDPVLMEILSNMLVSITEEIGYTIKRIAHSLYIREADDFTAALVTVDGKVFAYPSRIGVSSFADQDCGATIRAIPDVEPGDVIITNHPYLSEGMSTHLPDLHFLVPYFHEGRVICYGWLFAHFSDIGGRVPGSLSPTNTDLFQEGLQIPPMKLCSRGAFVHDTLAFINANARTPDANLGDIRALVAAQFAAQKRVAEVVQKFGVETFLQVQADLMEYAAVRARNVLRKIPDGTYNFWDYMDDDLLSSFPIRLRCKVTMRDGLMEIDFTGTDPQTLAAYNIPTCGKRNHWLTVRLMAFVITHDKSIPVNSGLFEPITIIAPTGTILNPVYPASVGLRATTASRVGDVVMGALQQAIPNLLPAASCGTAIPIVFSEPSSERGEQNVLIVQWCNGGTGGRYGLDGVDGRGASNANMSNNPLETVEDSASLVVEEYGLRPDSGGPGKWRGGVGVIVRFRALRDGCQVLARNSDRFRFSPWGVAGGRHSVKTRTILNAGRPDERDIGKIDVLSLRAGDTVTFLTPGGGGYGDPFERSPEAVFLDVVRGLVSIEAARRDYGVCISNGAVDEQATNNLRASRERPAPSLFSFDTDRDVWEQVCDDTMLNALNAKLDRLPPLQRWEKRKRILSEVFPELIDNNTPLAAIAHDTPTRRVRLQAAIAQLQ